LAKFIVPLISIIRISHEKAQVIRIERTKRALKRFAILISALRAVDDSFVIEPIFGGFGPV